LGEFGQSIWLCKCQTFLLVCLNVPGLR
jgi:hypothetical protein